MHGSPPSKGCHPDDYRVDFFELLKRIDGSLQCDEQFFENEHGSAQSTTRSLFDAMPALWKNLSCEDRHVLVNMIDRFPANVDPGSPIWNKANKRSLLKFGSLEAMPKMRASYMVSKQDPSQCLCCRPKTNRPTWRTSTTNRITASCKQPNLLRFI